MIQLGADGESSGQTLRYYGHATPFRAGTISTWVGSPQIFAFDKSTTLPDGTKVFAGPRKDPFYFDLAKFFKILPDRDFHNHPNAPSATAACFRVASNVHENLFPRLQLTHTFEPVG